MVSLPSMLKDPKMLKAAFGDVWGLRVWRGVVAVFVLGTIMGVVFAALHGYTALRAEFGPQVGKSRLAPQEKTRASGATGTTGISIDCGTNPNGFVGNTVIVGEMTGVGKGIAVHGDCVKDNDFRIHRLEGSPK